MLFNKLLQEMQSFPLLGKGTCLPFLKESTCLPFDSRDLSWRTSCFSTRPDPVWTNMLPQWELKKSVDTTHRMFPLNRIQITELSGSYSRQVPEREWESGAGGMLLSLRTSWDSESHSSFEIFYAVLGSRVALNSIISMVFAYVLGKWVSFVFCSF